MIRTEADLAKPIADWMRSRGYTVYAEVPSIYGAAKRDLVGRCVKDYAEPLMIVELKLNLTHAVIHQAWRSREETSSVWCAVGSSPRVTGLLEAARRGVGVLSVTHDGRVELHQHPAPYEQCDEGRRKKLNNYLDRMAPSDAAGRPCCSSNRPADECAQRVKAWIAARGWSSWAELYRAVPNHYASASSFASHMRGRGVSPSVDASPVPSPESPAEAP